MSENLSPRVLGLQQQINDLRGGIKDLQGRAAEIKSRNAPPVHASDRYSLAEARVIIDAEQCVLDEGYQWCTQHDAHWPDSYEECKARPEVADVAAQLLATVERSAEESLQRLARAAFEVDSKHHFHGLSCTCGFVGSERKRTQTEHITAAVLDAYDHD